MGWCIVLFFQLSPVYLPVIHMSEDLVIFQVLEGEIWAIILSCCSWRKKKFMHEREAHYISFPATRCLCWTRIRTWLMQVLELQRWTFPGYAWTQLEAVKSAVQRWWLEYDDEGYQIALHSKSPFEQMLVFENLFTYLCQSGAIHHFAKVFHLWLTLHTLRCHLKCKIFSPTWFGWNSHHL